LRLGEKSRSLPKNLIRSPELTILTLEPLDPLKLRRPRARPLALIPLRLPHPRRSVSLEQPIFSAIDSIAAHCDGYSPSGSSTSRTARSRISREYLFASFMTPIPRKLRPPANPGRFSTYSRSGEVVPPRRWPS